MILLSLNRRCLSRTPSRTFAEGLLSQPVVILHTNFLKGVFSDNPGKAMTLERPRPTFCPLPSRPRELRRPLRCCQWRSAMEPDSAKRPFATYCNDCRSTERKESCFCIAAYSHDLLDSDQQSFVFPPALVVDPSDSQLSAKQQTEAFWGRHSHAQR